MLPPSSIYNVQQDHYAFSPTGELVSTGVSPCVVVVVIFGDDTVMIEHRSDPYLYDKLDDDGAFKLYETTTNHIIDFKGDQVVIRDAFIIGGCNDQTKTELQQLLESVRTEIINDEESSESENGSIMVQLATAMKMVHVTWNIEQEETFGFNEPYLDIGVIKHLNVGLFLVIKQCFNMKLDETSSRVPFCCGVLSFKSRTSLNDPGHCEFYKKKANTSLTMEKDVLVYNRCLEKFVIDAERFGAQQINENDTSFTAALEQDMTNRITKKIPEGVVVKEF